MGKGKQKKDGRGANDKAADLAANTVEDQGEYLTTNQGVRVNDDQNTLKDGERGASLLEDFIFREKITHFDHERIPERVVHARGEGAHGYFEVTKSLKKYTRAKFLQKVGEKTKVCVRLKLAGPSCCEKSLGSPTARVALKTSAPAMQHETEPLSRVRSYV